jgi:hypothetical protein
MRARAQKQKVLKRMMWTSESYCYAYTYDEANNNAELQAVLMSGVLGRPVISGVGAAIVLGLHLLLVGPFYVRGLYRRCNGADSAKLDKVDLLVTTLLNIGLFAFPPLLFLVNFPSKRSLRCSETS